ncbi:MAG: lipocalin family protein [Muribaculaceae bacterium]|nr:lipocalin family protein [Muribaculaceae bacterium]
MKKIMKNILPLLLIALAGIAVSCNKGGINGDLDGQWRIETIELLADGTVSEPQGRFINMYLHTVNLTTGPVIVAGNMTYSGKELTFEFPYNQDNTSLNDWGIYNWQTTFSVEHLTGKSLVIASDAARITLSKF